MIKARAYLSFFFMVIIFFGLIARLYRIQIEQHDELSIRALKHHYASQNVKAERGRIFDRNGDLLVYSKNEISFYVNNKNKKNDVPDSVLASEFSKVFGKPFQHYMDLLSIDKSRVCLERKVSKKYKDAFKKLHCNRLYSETDNSRFYPYGSLAAHVLGYVNRDLIGVNGIERLLDEELKGKDGKLTFQIDAQKNIIGVEEKISIPPVDGKNVILTIDKNYQSILDEELLNGFNKFGGEAAVGIIVNPNTGEILALSNIPNYDPANYNLFDNESRRNRAISDIYEPGSTIKSIFLSMLFEEKLASPNEVINTENGKYKLYTKWIRDTHSFDKLTVREVLEHSSNVGIVKLSDRISPNKFYKYLRDFGFGNETHVDLPGEVAGILNKPSDYSKLSKPFISHGYEISVTPLQMTMAYAALVNGGVLYKPQIIKAIESKNGSERRVIQPERIRRVISKETSQLIVDMMEGVVENGTGETAQLTNIRVGGKTGTSHRYVDGEYSNTKYNSSFIGFFPVENPQIVIFIWVQSPKHGKYGGQVAGPIFKNVAERIVKSDLKFSKYRKNIDRTRNRKEYYTINLNTEKKYVSHSNPANKNVAKEKFETKRFTMPNLVGASIRKAMAFAASSGLKLKMEGRGRIIWQNIKPGSKIVAGKILEIKCGK